MERSADFLQLAALTQASLTRDPYPHAVVTGLFDPAHRHALAATFPTDHFRIVSGGAEKRYRYDARPLVAFGRDEVLFPDDLSPEWRALGEALASPEYRKALGELTGLDLTDAAFEANVFHYGPRCLLDPHPDLPDKIVTHVLYFNETWDSADGGCLRILRSSDPDDYVTEVLPLVGSSAVIVRAENSWHGVPAVRRGVARSRRSLTATFYRPGSKSTLFPDDEPYRLVNLGARGSGVMTRLAEVAGRALHRITRRR
jgi:Rps23 Pro-64 3,4-dihydroxylase Tpa1-like proline 4-hydroxylase